MNFEQLRSIIKSIKTRVQCPSCKDNYTNEDIFVVSTTKDKCVLLLQCHACSTPILVTASFNAHEVVQKTNEEAADIINNNDGMYIEDNIKIETDDVLDMHEFLKEFSGDFQGLFKG